MSGRRWTQAAVIAWICSVFFGYSLLARYAYQPGYSGEAATLWPLDSTKKHSSVRPTLVLFAHPQCPCTQATLDELEVFFASHPGAMDLRVFLFQPSRTPDDWQDSSEILRRVEQLGGAACGDVDGAIARRFGAKTSGHVYVYDVSGRLRFDGGVTPSRGCRGDNPGLLALQRLAGGVEPETNRTPIFGCPILREDES